MDGSFPFFVSPSLPLRCKMSKSSVANDFCFDFESLDPITIPIKTKGATYLLKEASGIAVARYKDAMFKGAQLDDEGHVKIAGSLAEPELVLLSNCVFHEDGVTPVPSAVVYSWPDRLTKPLIEKLKEISELKEVTTVEEGNPTVSGESSDTGAG